MASKRALEARHEGSSEDMQDGGLVDSIARSVECPVCKDCYEGGEQSKVPKLLPCFHTCCLHCIKSISSSSSKCPICQKPVPEDGLENLPTNFIALEVAETISLKSGSPKCCSLCDATSSTHFCSKCSTYMCEACKEGHSRQKLTKDHTVLTMQQARDQISRVVSIRSKMCDAHPTEMKDIFCVKCQVLACHKCILLSHSTAKGHEFESLDAAYDKAKEEVQASMGDSVDCEKILEGHLNKVVSVKDLLDSNADKAEDQLEEAFKLYAEMLEARKQELLDEVRSIKSTKMKALSTEEDELGMALIKSRTVREFAQEALQQECNVHLLSLKQGIVEGFKDVIQASTSYSGPCETEELTFDSSNERVQDYVKSIGCICALENSLRMMALEAGPKVITSDDGKGAVLGVKVYAGKIYALRTGGANPRADARIEVYRGTGELLGSFRIPSAQQQSDHSLDRFAVALNSIFYVQTLSLRKFELPPAGSEQVGTCSWTVPCSQAAAPFAHDIAVLPGDRVEQTRVFLSEFQLKTIRVLGVEDGAELQRFNLPNIFPGVGSPISIAVQPMLASEHKVGQVRLFVSGVGNGYEDYAHNPANYYSQSIFSVGIFEYRTDASASALTLLGMYTHQPGWHAPKHLVVDEQGSLLFTSLTDFVIRKVFPSGGIQNGGQNWVAINNLYPDHFSQQVHVSGMAADVEGNLVCCAANQIAVVRRSARV